MLFERDDVGLLCHFCSPSYAWCAPVRVARSRGD
jgi:hypothetical protein